MDIKILRDTLDEAWGILGRLILELDENKTPIDPAKVVEACDKIGDMLNYTDPELEGLTPRMKATYSTYQPLEVLRIVRDPTGKKLQESHEKWKKNNPELAKKYGYTE